MKPLTLTSPAKINLTLQILNKRADNYHNLKSEFQTVELSDKLTFTQIPEGIQLITKGKYKIPNNRDNLVYQIAEKLRVRAKGKVGIKIEIEKNIPLFAGLGGGSSNAATTMKALIKLWKLNLTLEKQIEISKEIGADVPFFLFGGHCLVEGIGEKITPLKPTLKNKWILIAQLPYIRISTPWAYTQFDKFKTTNYELPTTNSTNDFEPTIFKHFPDLKNLKNFYLQQGAKKANLTGSGSAVYGIFNTKTQAQKVKNILAQKCEFICLTKALS